MPPLEPIDEMPPLHDHPDADAAAVAGDVEVPPVMKGLMQFVKKCEFQQWQARLAAPGAHDMQDIEGSLSSLSLRGEKRGHPTTVASSL